MFLELRQRQTTSFIAFPWFRQRKTRRFIVFSKLCPNQALYSFHPSHQGFRHVNSAYWLRLRKLYGFNLHFFFLFRIYTLLVIYYTGIRHFGQEPSLHFVHPCSASCEAMACACVGHCRCAFSWDALRKKKEAEEAHWNRLRRWASG